MLTPTRALAALLALAFCAPALAQEECPPGKVQLNFPDREINEVVDAMSNFTGKNFIYDDRVRGRVTIVSPTCVTIDEAYEVFQSVLQVKGFTTVAAPGGAIKVIPLREAKETNVETVRGTTPSSDRFITRLIPLRYIDAEQISNTLKPLVSKDASMVAYPPTNTIILTDSGTNIRRILDILRDIDIETYKEELTVVHLKHADATTLAQQLSEIFFAEVSTPGGGVGLPASARQRRALQPQPGIPQQPGDAGPGASVRIITDARTNSLLILSSRQKTAEIKEAIARLDVKAEGGGRIHVYRLKHADAEELGTTLNTLLGGASAAPSGGGVAIAGGAAIGAPLRAAVTELAEGGLSVTPDPPTNSLVIQGSVEGFNALSEVIAKLDTPRPQVLVEALILEVDVSDGIDLGFSGLATITDGNDSFGVGSLSGGNIGTAGNLSQLLAAAAGKSFAGGAQIETGKTVIQALLTASAKTTGTNVLSAPHILTLDNEQAEIKVGSNIPIITSRIESAQGQSNPGLASSVNVERLDIGVTLRVTPQISEGETLRLKLFQEITGVTSSQFGSATIENEVGPTLTNRKVENSVVVSDGETVVIGGLIDETNTQDESKVPWLGDIPLLGWLFKSTSDDIVKTNLLIFLTPHIIRTHGDHAGETIRKREEFWQSSEDNLQLSRRERKEADRLAEEATRQGKPVPDYSGSNPVRSALRSHREAYPVEQLSELDAKSREERAAAEGMDAANGAKPSTRYEVLAATYGDEVAAMSKLQQLIDAGHDGTLRTEGKSGTVLYEIYVGPFDDVDAAEDKAAALAEPFELSPKVMLVRENAP
ncbi:MAG: type II secretion system secretin GspD [Deltaproteobacteria bacterium]|nr:type II secretion system secretin GspD [Deltaproteobacteria bacterium]